MQYRLIVRTPRWSSRASSRPRAREVPGPQVRRTAVRTADASSCGRPSSGAVNPTHSAYRGIATYGEVDGEEFEGSRGSMEAPPAGTMQAMSPSPTPKGHGVDVDLWAWEPRDRRLELHARDVHAGAPASNDHLDHRRQPMVGISSLSVLLPGIQHPDWPSALFPVHRTSFTPPDIDIRHNSMQNGVHDALHQRR